MKMNETTFENAKVGDRVWDLRHGWGTVNDRQDSALYPLAIWFDNGTCLGFLFNGYCSNSALRTLFWDEIKFEAPPRPKRRIKKVVEGYVNLQEMRTGVYNLCLPVWIDKGDAERERLEDRVYLGEPLFIHHEYEVEE